MKLSLIFADCEVIAVVIEQDGVRVRLSAAHVEQASQANGARPVEGFSRGVSVLVVGAGAPDGLASMIGRVSNGRAQVAGSWASSIALPVSVAGDVRLELAFANHSQLALSGCGLRCWFDGEPNFAESLFC